jgi:dienelactone hydrolase
MHDALGLGEVRCGHARRLAQAGYLVLASDMYGEGRHSPDPAKASEPFRALQQTPERLRARALAGLAALRSAPQVDQGRIGAVGFCFGGQCVLEVARSGADVRGVVSFHGLLKTAFPARTGEMKAKVLVLTGAKDPFAPPEDVNAFQAEMAEAGADWQLTVYGEGRHAFTDPTADSRSVAGLRYDPQIASLAWAQAIAFLNSVVRDA